MIAFPKLLSINWALIFSQKVSIAFASKGVYKSMLTWKTYPIYGQIFTLIQPVKSANGKFLNYGINGTPVEEILIF